MSRLGHRIALALAVAAAALTLSAGQTPGKGRGLIVIHGGHSGTHLTLTAVGPRLIVHGHLADAKPIGCRLKVLRRLALCSLRTVDAIRVVTGPSDDKVEVLTRLPVRLTALLGAGSDKLIGNGERDFCYPGGSRRNRCTLGGGNDVCITGPRNTDCRGGPGNDVCRASSGSDGCWGGPGQDVCYMGPGNDGCHGDGGRDRLYGGSGHDRLYGEQGFDYCDGGVGAGRSQSCEAGPRH